jgi:hypothetical protein
MLLIVSGTVCVFLNVAAFGTVATPTASLPNDRVAGVKVVCARADDTKISNSKTQKELRRAAQ